MTLTIWGLSNFANVFADMALPAGVEKELAISAIFEKCAELELLYPSAPLMQNMVKYWSARELPAWEKLHKTTMLEYNPIENYDSVEEWQENGSENASDRTTGNSRNTGRTAGFNSTALVDNSADIGEVENDTKTTAERKADRRGRRHGNIGVTTTQEMIRQEREVVTFNIYDFIADDFKKRFCLLVY